MIILLCGLSGVGKTTLSRETKKLLNSNNISCEVLDGDEIRNNLFKDLGFSQEERKENMRRLAFLANKFSKNGIVTIVSAISPYKVVREEIKAKYERVKIIHIDCEIKKLLERDTKGLYHKALLPDGHPDKIYNLTGINDIFERPEKPDLYINTTDVEINVCTKTLFDFIVNELNSQNV
ncbi:adenylyl-sulfate kinase [Olivibacter sp. XZL3]|uniref:adenylyl-sulfate kinase n=1 Tax=Olivibacter sp. XZL3 TaxID=1735116 RepID=UPI001066F148|nr:adenylyl-sulfate kinase [Olivibacter sp. XZL3]